MITTTALINAILLLCIQIQLKYTIVSKVTSHAKDEGKKEATRSDNDRHKFRCDR
jgi:hypothetical protein